MVRPLFSLPSCHDLKIMTDWVPLSLKGTQRGEVYLEMTFFAAGPAPLTRRPSKFTNPNERLARPQQSAQRPQQVAYQPQPSLLSPGGQGPQGSRINSHESARRGRRPTVQQVPLPGAWPGRSAQQQQQQQPQAAAPSHFNRRPSKSDDAPLPPLPQDTEPKGEIVPSILRPGGPSRPVMHAMQDMRVNSPDTHAHAQERYQTGTPPLANGTAGHHHIPPSDTNPNTYHTHQNTVPFHGSLAPHANIHSPPPQAQPHAHPVSSYPTQGTLEPIGVPSGGYASTQPSLQAQPQFTHAQYNSQSQPPTQQWHQVQHGLRQQAQSPVGHVGHATSPHPPDSHPAQSYVAASSPSPSHSYVQPQAVSQLALSQTSTQQGPPPVSHSHAQPYATVQSPVLSARPFVASPSPGPSAPPAQPYVNASSPIPPSQPYALSSVPSAQPYAAPTNAPTNAIQQTQPYVSLASLNVSPRVQSPAQQATHSPPILPYISPPNPTFSLPTSPPPMPSYGPSYAPAHGGPSFPAPSFPVPQPTLDYFETSPTSPYDDTDLPDPYLLKRYQTPLPLPPGASRPQGPDRNAKAKPKPSPPAAVATATTAPAPAPVANHTWRDRREDESERAARELQRLEDENARARREQEERDAELARTLDLQLNADD